MSPEVFFVRWRERICLTGEASLLLFCALGQQYNATILPSVVSLVILTAIMVYCKMLKKDMIIHHLLAEKECGGSRIYHNGRWIFSIWRQSEKVSNIMKRKG